VDGKFIDGLIATWECENIDFKKEYHDNNASFIHDILCLLNASSKENRYLVIGVDDTSRDKVGLSVDQNRKSNAELQDLLRGSNFNRFPDVKINTILYGSIEIDVIEIMNRPDKPFYLIRDKSHNGKTVRSGIIYTRLGDTNTPINGFAQEERVELMWRERFGIGQPPLKRLEVLLESPEEWIAPENDVEMHHRVFPEFNIKEGEIINDPYKEYWTDNFPDKKAYSKKVRVRYFGTLIYSMGFVVCDGGRYKIPIPNLPPLGQMGNYFLERTSIEYKVANLINRMYMGKSGRLYRLLTSVGIDVG
jgi:Putative DNA-binding domain